MTGILIFAAIAVVLFFQLRAVLGRRTGEERERPNPFEGAPTGPYRPAAEVPKPGAKPVLVIDHDPTLPLSLDARLAKVQAAEPSFEEKHFLAGSKAAFQMVVEAFAVGDLATLRPLLSSPLYGELGRTISERKDQGALGPVTFDGPVQAEIIDAKVIGRQVQVQVRFTSKQRHAGETTPPEHETVDLWTFAREAGARDPNWQLIETATLDN